MAALRRTYTGAIQMKRRTFLQGAALGALAGHLSAAEGKAVTVTILHTNDIHGHLTPWLGWVMQINPFTYGMAAFRRCLYLGSPVGAGDVPPLALSLLVTLLFCAVTFVGAIQAARLSRG